ncbi:DNA-directed RNA polymerase subunit omega [bacterium]|nr:DNA-directed RNA polymerase subunit omega [bacterium]MBU1653102.1 DNA-directed RNA polymerase subunit omega [bacterium]
MSENLLRSLSEETNFEMQKDARQLDSAERKDDGYRHDLLAEDFTGKATNIYEAIIIMSQRARQIGQKQAQVIEKFMSSKSRSEEGEGDIPEIFVSEDDDDEERVRLPRFEKPTVVALNEMYNDQLNWNNKDE